MLTEISIQEYFSNFSTIPLIDVRSPGEYDQGHVVGAINIPLFSNDERADVGRTYVQESREKAIELGYKYVEPKLQWFIDESRNVAPEGVVAVHCWRGGMRSHSFAEHLHKNGFRQVYIIKGGYKAFRKEVLNFFDQPFNLRILGGYTGSGKTFVLEEIGNQKQQVVDLEGLAHHKGSAFGAIGEKKQPTVEHFENKMYEVVRHLDLSKPIWVEDESHNIGRVKIPITFFRQMREQVVYFIDVPKPLRARHLVLEYAAYGNDVLANAINAIAKRLGGLNVKMAHQHLQENNYFEVAMITLKYYDKAYTRGIEDRDQSKVVRFELTDMDFKSNAKTVIEKVENYERNKTNTI